MKQLVAIAPQQLRFLDYEDRPLLSNEVYIKVMYASPKHGSEQMDFRGKSPFMNEYYDQEWQVFSHRPQDEPRGIEFGKWNVGNMIVGEIIEKGKDVFDFEKGDIVCSYGGIRETHILNAVNNHRLHKLPDITLWKSALCYDPAQFALGGVRDGNVLPGDFIAIFGLGAIGQVAVQICKKIGTTVIAIDPIENRRKIASGYGADHTIDPMTVDTGLELKKLSGKKGMDVIIETSGSKEGLQQSLRGLAYGGTLSYVAWAKEFPAGLDLGREAHHNNAKIIFSRVASEPFRDHPRWNRKRIEQTVWEMITSGYISGDNLIQPVVPFAEAAEAYTTYLDKYPEQSIKLGIYF
jgi:threonine dehydrogenase-like Zn-dependent dehydrogenase